MPLTFQCLESIDKLCCKGLSEKAKIHSWVQEEQQACKPTGTCILVYSADKLQVILAAVANNLFQYSSRPVGVFLSLCFEIESSFVESIFSPLWVYARSVTIIHMQEGNTIAWETTHETVCGIETWWC